MVGKLAIPPIQLEPFCMNPWTKARLLENIQADSVKCPENYILSPGQNGFLAPTPWIMVCHQRWGSVQVKNG